MTLLRGGLVRQMSFGFTVREDKFDGDLRTLLDVDLAEISLVERAAYPQTNADARALSRSHLVTTKRIALRIKNLKGKL
jgi:HK97 family phage prohead protease